MTFTILKSRRSFLKTAGAAGVFSFASTMDKIGLASALAQTAPGYKALVCVFLFGGNDGNNTIVPVDARFTDYEKVRAPDSPGAPSIGLTQAQLLALNGPAGASGLGVHPSMQEMQTLFLEGKAAVLANVGTLMQPMTRAEYLNRTKIRPESLFSHNDQQAQWMSSTSAGDILSGWGGRIADKLAPNVNGTSPAPVAMSFAGSQIFGNGEVSRLMALPGSGGFSLTGLPTTSTDPVVRARLNALQQLIARDQTNQLAKAAGGIFNSALSASAVIDPILSRDTFGAGDPAPNTNAALPVTNRFRDPNNNNAIRGGVSRSLLQVAKMVEAVVRPTAVTLTAGGTPLPRSLPGRTRDIFFVSQGGYDTHNGQINSQGTLLRDLSIAINSFQRTMEDLGVADKVTLFTLSDFGRTFKPAAGAPPGSDHAWGSHHFVVGGAVKGGRVYGTYPTLALGGPDDVSSEGRWIPTTSIEQYGTELATWFGVPSADLDYVFPRRGQFAAPPDFMV